MLAVPIPLGWCVHQTAKARRPDLSDTSFVPDSTPRTAVIPKKAWCGGTGTHPEDFYRLLPKGLRCWHGGTLGGGFAAGLPAIDHHLEVLDDFSIEW